MLHIDSLRETDVDTIKVYNKHSEQQYTRIGLAM